MDILLVPGLWLDGASWEPVLDPLRAAGHAPRALTMPGLGARATEASGIGIRDWIDAVVDEIDGAAGDVVLVGHSGGGNVIWGAADARPDRIARAVFVDTVPPPDGFGINEFAAVDGLVPFPGWDFFPDEDVRDLDAAVRARTSALMRSVPARATSDPVRLADPRRFDVPVTLLMGRPRPFRGRARPGSVGAVRRGVRAHPRRRGAHDRLGPLAPVLGSRAPRRAARHRNRLAPEAVASLPAASGLDTVGR